MTATTETRRARHQDAIDLLAREFAGIQKHLNDQQNRVNAAEQQLQRDLHQLAFYKREASLMADSIAVLRADDE